MCLLLGRPSLARQGNRGMGGGKRRSNFWCHDRGDFLGFVEEVVNI